VAAFGIGPCISDRSNGLSMPRILQKAFRKHIGGSS
jgi:hypothetical protein